MSELTVVVAERGASWVEWAEAWAGPGRELVVMLQQAQESAGEFRERVEQRLSRVMKRAEALHVVLASSERSDEGQQTDHERLLETVSRVVFSDESSCHGRVTSSHVDLPPARSLATAAL
jgi:hypothetical protein